MLKPTHDLHPLPPRHPKFLPSSKGKPHAAAKSQSKADYVFPKVFNGDDAKTILTKWLGKATPLLMSYQLLGNFEAKNPSPFWSKAPFYKKLPTSSSLTADSEDDLPTPPLKRSESFYIQLEASEEKKSAPGYSTSPTFSDDSELISFDELNEVDEAELTEMLGEAPTGHIDLPFS